MALGFLTTSLPTGVSPTTLVCLYQFDGPTNGLDDRSGNGHHLHTFDGGAEKYSIHRNGEMALVNGGSLSDYPLTDNKTDFRELGALTVEWVGSIMEWNTGAPVFLWEIGNLWSASSSLNTSCSAGIRDSDTYPARIFALHEYGAGTNESVDFDWGMPHCVLEHFALTRASDGVTYKLYAGGRYLQTKVAANAPDNGGGSWPITLMCRYNDAGSDAHGHLSSWRYCKGVEFTAAQVLESFNAIRV